MQHNIPLLRRIYEQITQHPETHDQSKWCGCVAGWALAFDGGYRFLQSSILGDAVQAVDLRTGEIDYIEDIATRLLGMMTEEGHGLFSSTEREAVAWIEDILVAHDMRELDKLAARGNTDHVPSEVTA